MRAGKPRPYDHSGIILMDWITETFIYLIFIYLCHHYSKMSKKVKVFSKNSIIQSPTDFEHFQSYLPLFVLYQSVYRI